MDVVRRLFRRAAALALIAMLGLALAPTVSHALAAKLASAQPWNELCSVDGEQDAGAQLAHCPLCVQPGHSPALPSPARSWAVPLEAFDEVPVAAGEHIALRFARVVPPSRAPPPVAVA